MSGRTFDLDKYLMNNPIRGMIQRKFVGTYFSKVARVLKPKGQFFFEEPIKPILDFVLIRPILNHPKDGLFTACEFEQALKEAQFTLSDLKEADSIFIRGTAFIPA